MKIASLLLLTGLTGSLVFACNGSGDSDGDDGSTGTGGLGGASSSGGSSSGSGGATGPTSQCDEGERGTTVAAGTCNLINDFEGDAETFGASFALDADGRVGAGIDIDAATDKPRLSGGKDSSGEGSLEVVADGANGSSSSVKFTFSGAKEWGGSFTHLISNSACYDASSYSGITFWAKATSDKKDIFVAVVTADSSPIYDCTPEVDCFNHARKAVTVTDTWAQYTLEWDDFARPNWGKNWGTNPDPERVIGLVFADNGTDANDNAIELFVDDIAFTGGDASACGEPGGGEGGAGGE